MDCPNCGVYNPEDRTICWRCDKKKRDPAQMQRRMWLIVGIALILWIVLSWLLPLLLGGGVPGP
jgi:predicted nucleic acid-binding Zn ribbon protein